ncbi:MAG: DUF411 domain-containing protein [Methylobacter sp.]|nr:DUF411 domain-containing protein [Methylobacter sp.]MDP2100045.1 DUF411 domain-containing protein [Methylobacter sp.]MDP2429246.1 DUF411 domain-containing protein [Methylobacter sp.]MDP3055701.1 DUF411 domain-containing protein [Methylobacter sp.]MDP3361457.1 DUF411 domain-containing protein [Methylobacter sp.]
MKSLKLVLAMGLLAGNVNIKADDKPIDIVVHRSPTCTCCGKWIDHLKQNNFKVQDIVTNDVQAVKDKYGITEQLASCHTAVVEGYAVEGHVPADDIKKMLTTKPKIVGLAVPGMVTGSPGMEMGGKTDPYQVVSFDAEKHVEIVNSYEDAK